MIQVIVNRNTIIRNAYTGSNDPPFSVLRSGQNAELAHEVKLKGDATLIYRPEKPLLDGARVWIEAEDAEVISR